MRKLWASVQVDNEEKNKSFELDYYVLAKEVCIEGQKALRFGVEVYKKAKRPNGTPYAEYRKIFDVFQTEAEAQEVLSLMARNTVTPIAMQDILEDLLGIREFVGEVQFSEAV